jgi:uncharacterized protein (DUF58 family)
MAWSGAHLQPLGNTVAPDSISKLAYAEILTASLALLLIRQRDAVGLVRFDEKVRSAVPPRARTGHWRRVLAALEEPGAGLASSAPEALHQAARLINRRGMIVLISDLLMEQGEVERTMRGLRAMGHDVTVLHVMDPAERWLGGTGEALFFDPETDLHVPASVSDVRAAYRSTVEEVIAEWRDLLSSTGVSYEVVTTDQSFGVPLRRAFAARQRLF